MADLKTMQCSRCSERFDFDPSVAGMLTCPYCQAQFQIKRRATAQVTPIAPPPGLAAPASAPAPVPAPVPAATLELNPSAGPALNPSAALTSTLEPVTGADPAAAAAPASAPESASAAAPALRRTGSQAPVASRKTGAQTPVSPRRTGSQTPVSPRRTGLQGPVGAPLQAAAEPEIDHAPEAIPGEPGYRAKTGPRVPTAAQAPIAGTGARDAEAAAAAPARFQIQFTAGALACLFVAVIGFTVAGVNYSQHLNRVARNDTQRTAYENLQSTMKELRLSTTTDAKTIDAKREQYNRLAIEWVELDKALRTRDMGPAGSDDPRVGLTAEVKKLEIRRDMLARQLEATTTAATQAKLGYAQETTEMVARNHKHSVVIVELKGLGFGTGFVIAGSRVITNFHVVAEGADIDVKYLVDDPAAVPGSVAANATPGGRGHFESCKSVKVLAVDRERDLALLEVDFGAGPAPGALTLQPNAIQGEKVCAIGNPGMGHQMLEHTVSEGIVAGLNRLVGKKMFHQITAAINPGNSGGPVFNMRGEVIGVATLKATGADNLGFAIPAADVQTFVDTWQDHKIDGSYEAWLMQENPLKYRLTKIRAIEAKYVTSTPIGYSFCDAGVDNASNLWLADEESNRLVNYSELNLKNTKEIALSGRPVAMTINATAGIAYVMLAGGTKIAKVSLGTAKELEVFTLQQACAPLLVPLDGQNLITISATGGLALINIVTKKYVNLGRAFSLGNLKILTLSVSSKTVDVVGIDGTGSLVVKTDSVYVIRNLATLINQADQATTEAKFNQIAEQILKVKYFATESSLPIKVIKNEIAMFCFHEGPGNSCFLANAILKGPAPYKSSGSLPSMLDAIGAPPELQQRFSVLENLYCTSPDLHYGATGLGIYDLTTNKILKPLPFVAMRSMFSHDGKTLFCFVEGDDGNTRLLRFPWKEVPDIDLTGKAPPAPPAPPAPAVPATPKPNEPAEPPEPDAN